MNLEQGDYMIRLDEDFSANYYSGDCGYTGMAVLEDGTFILHSYGHWDEAFSKSYVDPSTGSYNVRTDLCWILQAKFKLGEVENDEGLVDWSELEAKVAEVKDAESGKYTADTWTRFAAALKTAQEKIPAGESQQIQVNTMLADLTEAYEALEENKELPAKPENSDKEKAQKYYDECKAYYVENDYTKASWAAYKNAMEALKAVLAKDDATTAELQAAVKAVYEAAHKLVKAPVSIETPETPATSDKPDNTKTPTTGDTANVLSFTVIMFACAMAVVILRKRLAK